MSIDLEQELARLAGSVHDDATTERMSRQVGTMVSRIRRRRAARHTARGAVGIGAAAAVALGGMQLADRGTAPPADPTPSPVPSVSPSPTTDPTGFGACGREVLIPGDDGEHGVTVVGEVLPDAPRPDILEVLTSFTVTSDAGDVADVVEDPVVVLTRDGVVVSPVGEVQAALESFPPQFGVQLPLTSCEDGTDLPDGEYEVYALQRLTRAGEATLEVAGGPWPVALPLGGEAGGGLTGEEQDALVTRNEMLSAPVENPDGVFPLCGTVAADALDGGTPELELDLVLDPSVLTLTPGDRTIPDGVALHTTDRRYAIANASPLARVVLLMDGVVVAYPFLDTEDVTDVALEAGQAHVFPLRTITTLCGTGEGGQGDPLPLPPGDYTAVAAVDLLVKETGAPGEEPDGTTRPMTVVSEPVTVTVD